MSGKIAVLGAGSWGTALATVLGENGYSVTLWSRDSELVARMAKARCNVRYLPNVILKPNITVTDSANVAVDGAEAVIFVVPSQAVREVARLVSQSVRRDQLIIHAAKGFEAHTLKRITRVLSEELPTHDEARIVVLSGPSHAEEVALGQPTTVVVACENMHLAERAQDLLINGHFRVYTNPDTTGVEVGGALKNIIALGAGMSDGLGFGDNAKAALLTRGLAEITRLGVKMGAQPLTFAGLAGIGDLVVTCTSKHSRNWRAGHLLGQGRSLKHVLNEMNMVVEGVKTTEAAFALSKQFNTEMPITYELYNVLFHGKDPKVAVGHLMERGKTHEMEEIMRGL